MGKIFKSILKVVGIVAAIALPGLGAVIGAALFTGISIADRLQARNAAKKQGNQAQSLNQMVRNAIMPRRIVYGRRRVGGMWFYYGTDTNKTYIYLILGLCEGPIEAIETIYFNEEEVTLDGSGNATGKFADHVRITKYLGAAGQTADPNFVSERTDFDASRKFLGIAYLAIRLKWSSKLFGNTGLPNISAVVLGRNDVYDSRSTSTAYSTNVALCLQHYLELPKLGSNVSRSPEIGASAFEAAASVCDEFVALAATAAFTSDYSQANTTLNATAHGLFDGQIVNLSSTDSLPAPLAPATDYFIRNATPDSFQLASSLDGALITLTNNGTGTHTFTAKERRYTFNAVLTLDANTNPEDIRNLFAAAMAGSCIYTQGQWNAYAGAYDIPAHTITTDHIVGDFEFSPEQSKKERINTVKGMWVGAENRWHPTDYPVVTNASYLTVDGEELPLTLDLPGTNSPTMAQRIAKIHLEKSRRQKKISLKSSLEALRLTAGRTCQLTYAYYGLNAQTFDVDFWAPAIENNAIVIDLQLSETDANVYAWSSSEEGSYNVPANPTVADFGQISAPTNLAAANGSGPNLVSVVLTWDQTPDQSVLDGGNVRIGYKKTADTAWIDAATIDGASVQFEIGDLEYAVNYDFRVSFINFDRAQSDPTTVTGHTTVASSGTSAAYTHVQSTPATVWTINHNLGYIPGNVTAYDHEGTEIEPSRISNTLGQFQLIFHSAVYGVAYVS